MSRQILCDNSLTTESYNVSIESIERKNMNTIMKEPEYFFGKSYVKRDYFSSQISSGNINTNTCMGYLDIFRKPKVLKESEIYSHLNFDYHANIPHATTSMVNNTHKIDSSFDEQNQLDKKINFVQKIQKMYYFDKKINFAKKGLDESRLRT